MILTTESLPCPNITSKPTHDLAQACDHDNIAFEAVGKRPSAVRQAHGPEQSRRAALPSSLVTVAYFYVRLSQIPLSGGVVFRIFQSV
jgi:hypothetical protein